MLLIISLPVNDFVNEVCVERKVTKAKRIINITDAAAGAATTTIIDIC